MDFSRPKVMGIVNVTPDSFSDGGRFDKTENALAHIRKLIDEGAELIDIGGESTGPGSPDVSEEEEMARVRPVIDAIAEAKLTEQALFSIDTYKAPVARYALSRGFGMVNDVTALRGDPAMMDTLTTFRPYVVLMFAKDPTPRTTRDRVEYDDVIAAIKTFFRKPISALIEAGFPAEKIILDPGMGLFVSGDAAYSHEIIDRLGELKALGYPMLVGPSRKSFLGGAVADRDEISWQVAKKALQNGAAIVRMHTVRKLQQA